MPQSKFEQAKLKRLLSMHGIQYHFVRLEKNKFGGTIVPHVVSATVDLVGVYHEQNQGIQVVANNEVRYRTEKRPFILAEYNVASQLLIDDTLVINDVNYRVVGVHNVSNLNVYGDIALEVIDVGRQI